MGDDDVEAKLRDSQERWTEVRCAYCLAPPRSLCYCRQAYQLGAQARQEAIVAWLRDSGERLWWAKYPALIADAIESGAALEADGGDKST